MSKLLSIFLIINQLILSSAFAAKKCPNLDGLYEIKKTQKFANGMVIALEDLVDPCTGKLSKKDRDVVNNINKELAEISSLKNQKLSVIRKKTAAVIKKHESDLSEKVKLKIIATAQRKSLERVLKTLKENKELSKKYLAFKKTIESKKLKEKKCFMA